MSTFVYSILSHTSLQILNSTMDVKEYKKYHEEHMMHNIGTSVEECFILLSSIPFCVFLSSYLSSYKSKTTSFIFEFLTIILPVILNCTLLSDISHIIFLSVVLLWSALFIRKSDTDSVKNFLNKKYEGKKLFISNYRGSTNFVSAICILAVDFMVFPKRLAKTESFGVGFMDLGVGFFICCNGFVEKHSVSKGQFVKLLKTELILCGLGLMRVISVKSIDYHEHVSEYGVHWNFFFTLAVCRLLSYCIIFLTDGTNPFYLSTVTGLILQISLILGLQEWVLGDTPRASFLTANREGLVSSLGYISLYFAACGIGKYVLQPKNLTYKKLFLKLLSVCIIMWIGTVISLKTVGISRRLCNMGYIFWILALSLTELIFFVIVEISLNGLRELKQGSSIKVVPRILESINAHGLLFFILSNLLTGLVNLIFQTLLLGKMMSMIIIISYMVILCGITHVLFLRKFHFSL